jgi:DNA-binding PadR family transcriptional regulator
MKLLPRIQREVLQVLAGSGRTHAYEIKLRLRDAVGHSSVYAALARAEAKGYVEGIWEEPSARAPESGPPRKYYVLTAAGLEALRSAEAAVPAGTRPEAALS